MNVHVYSWLFAGKEKESEPQLAEDCGTHLGSEFIISPRNAAHIRLRKRQPDCRLFELSFACYSQLFVRQQSLMAAATEEKVLASNRAAFHNYHISTKYEAGAALTGTEVKSVLGGRIQLKDSYVAIQEGEAWLLNAHISPYSHGNRANHDPLRIRKLLLHRREIDRLEAAASAEGMTLVITRVYVKNRKIKFEVGVAKGKKLYDKRETELRRIVDRETRAQLKQRNR